MRHIVSINSVVVKDVGYDWRGFGIVMGVRAERGRLGGWGFTPILTFPRRGGRDFAYPCQPVEGEGTFAYPFKRR